IDRDVAPLLRRQGKQPLREQASLALVIALDVDEEAAVGKGCQHLVQRGHQADALAAEGEGLPAIGGVAMSDVQRLEFGHATFARDALAVRAAIKGPVVEDSEL